MLRLELYISRLLGRWKGREQGGVMPMALIALTLGALLITPTLSHMSTGIKYITTQARVTSELYVADAGIEYAMWHIKNDYDLPVPSPITLNDITMNIAVAITTDLRCGPVVTGGGTHADRLQVSSNIVDEGGTITYTITIKNVGPSTIHLVQIGADLPDSFTYKVGSSSGMIRTTNPDINGGEGGQIIWNLDPKYTIVSSFPDETVVTQTFEIEGSGTLEDYYSWATANSTAIGTVSSLVGYNIVVSKDGGGTTIEANAVKNTVSSNVFPVSWEVN